MDLKPPAEDGVSNHPASVEAFANTSTLHGISHIFTYERFSFKRIIWTLAFLGSLSFLVHTCTQRIQYYFQYPHVTKLDEISATNMTFPAITICNLNEFRFSKITKNDLYHAGELLTLLNNRYEIPDPHLAERHILEALVEKANFRNFKPKPFNMREFYARAGHDMKDMLLHCIFRGEFCTAQDFKIVSAVCLWLSIPLGVGGGLSRKVKEGFLTVGCGWREGCGWVCGCVGVVGGGMYYLYLQSSLNLCLCKFPVWRDGA
uniref:Si:dkey-57c15.1 n=1 Tax=Callorhinchus milii TaxID=7868 RepID=A0A4W3GXX9_CALMI